MGSQRMQLLLLTMRLKRRTRHGRMTGRRRIELSCRRRLCADCRRHRQSSLLPIKLSSLSLFHTVEHNLKLISLPSTHSSCQKSFHRRRCLLRRPPRFQC